MLAAYCLMKPIYWIVPWILQVIGYYFILKKMQLQAITALLPFSAEWEMSGVLMRRMRKFYRPFFITLILALAAIYLGSSQLVSKLYMIVAFVIYGLFLIHLYYNLAKAFGRNFLFAVGLTVLPPVFLLILGLGKSQYTPLEFKPEKERTAKQKKLRTSLLATVSVIEMVVIVAVIGAVTVRTYMPSGLVKLVMKEAQESSAEVSGTGKIVTREDTMGKKISMLDELEPSRDYFAADHSNDKSAVVFTYIVGSDLEDRMGFASVNIEQMIEASKQGDGLKFVIETGGSNRWFTDGIKDESYGRYEIANGEMKKVENLPANLSMSDEAAMEDFLKWGKKNYKADRYMLVMWDHGSGLEYGFGLDRINDRTEEMSNDSYATLSVAEMAEAVGESGIKFDLIGFDACLMQSIEIAKAFEPYADYYVASEETEPGFGWFYTSAFGKLAENPGISTTEFAKELIASYDPYVTATTSSEGKTNPMCTLSLVDLTRVGQAYEAVEKFFDRAATAMSYDPGAYADFATAADNAYKFTGNHQVDLINFIKILKRLDYDGVIYSDAEKNELVRTIQSCIVYRNGASAKGINGLALAIPYTDIASYTNLNNQFESLSLYSQKHAEDIMFSIMAAQQKKANELEDAEGGNQGIADRIQKLYGIKKDRTDEEWYISGFENYDDTKEFNDIPLEKTDYGYEIQLADKAWKIINDVKTVVYQRVDENEAELPKGATRRYIGADYSIGQDENGNPTLKSDNSCVYVNGRLVCYETAATMETDEGRVYSGTIKARLNGKKTVVLQVKWDAVDEGLPKSGSITGYVDNSLFSFMNSKGYIELKAGDSIEFLFDYYDEEGKLVDTAVYGKKIRVSKQGRLKVKVGQLESCETIFHGLMTDVYRRPWTTEEVSMKVD